MKTRNLRPHVYELKTYPDRPSPYVARWVVNGKTRGRSFAHKTQADNFRAEFIHAINSRERFSNLTGLPRSMETKKEIAELLREDDVSQSAYLKYSLNIMECTPTVCADVWVRC